MFEKTLPVGQLPPSASSDPTLRTRGYNFSPLMPDRNRKNLPGGPLSPPDATGNRSTRRRQLYRFSCGIGKNPGGANMAEKFSGGTHLW